MRTSAGGFVKGGKATTNNPMLCLDPDWLLDRQVPPFLALHVDGRDNLSGLAPKPTTVAC